MSEAFHFYEPEHGHGLPHDPFKAVVAPRPIGWISSRADDGTLNLAPYSFFNAVSGAPPMLAFSSSGYKDSVDNIERTREFAWNLATRTLAASVNASSAAVGPEVDEFRLAGVTPAPSHVIAVTRVAESPASLECRLSEVVRLRRADGDPTDNWLVIGEVVGVHIARSLLVEGVYDTAAAQPIMRAGGPADYFGIVAEQRFRMERP